MKTQHPIEAHYVALDLAQAGSHQVVAEEVAKRKLTVDWLINNAGVGTGGDLLDYSLKEYQHMMHLNMDAVVALTYQFLPPMRARKSGTIINVGSMAGFSPIPYMNLYAAIKGFVKYFTEALWEENRLYNIHVMLLCPGATETGFFEAAKIDTDRKGSFSTQTLETPQQVVESAIRGLKKQSMVTISGFQNKLSRRLLGLVPREFGLRTWGKMLRKNLKIAIK